MVCASATECGAVGEGDRAGLGQQADLGDLAPLEALGQRRRGKDADLRVVARAPQDEVDHRRVVDRRVGVGPHDEARDAAGGRGGAGAGDRLAMLGPRLADEDAHVDEARRDHVAPAVDDPRLVRKLVARHRRADPGDDPVHGEEPAARFRLALGIDEAGVEKGDRRAAHGRPISQRRRGLQATRSNAVAAFIPLRRARPPPFGRWRGQTR